MPAPSATGAVRALPFCPTERSPYVSLCPLICATIPIIYFCYVCPLPLHFCWFYFILGRDRENETERKNRKHPRRGLNRWVSWGVLNGGALSGPYREAEVVRGEAVCFTEERVRMSNAEKAQFTPSPPRPAPSLFVSPTPVQLYRAGARGSVAQGAFFPTVLLSHLYYRLSLIHI